MSKEYRFRIVGLPGEKEAEERMNAVVKEMAQEGFAYKEVHYRSFEFQGIRHSALMVFEREVVKASAVPSTAKGGLS